MKVPYLLRSWITATLIASWVTQVLASDDIMAGYYGNTVVAKGGMTDSYTHYRPDHTFDVSVRLLFMAVKFQGTWRIDENGELCLSFDDPVPPKTPNPLCKPAVPRKVGDTWIDRTSGTTRKVIVRSGTEY